MSTVDIVGNLVRVELSSSILPTCVIKRNKSFVYFGENNNYFGLLIDLYRRHAAHNAIIKSKAKYIYGKGLQIEREKVNTLELAKGQSFLSAANRYEDWNSVFEKTCKPLELFNGWAWQIIWSMGGTKVEVFALQTSRCRSSEDGKTIAYCECWVNDKGEPLTQPELDKRGYREYPAFDPNVRTGTQIYFYKVAEQFAEECGDIYPTPEYIGATESIITDVAIKEFQRCLVENGMSAQGILSFFNGMPTEEEKKKITKLFNKKYAGPGKAGQLIFNFVDQGQDSKGAEYTTFTASDLDKKWELMGKTNQQDIFTGHGVTNKSLYGISTEGALSDRTTIVDSFEQMQNTYTVPRRRLILDEIKMIAGLVGVNLDHLDVQNLEPLGVDITAPEIAKYFSEDEIREKLGYKPREVPVDPSVPAAQAQVNENLQGLTGRDWIHVKRIAREVSKGILTRDAGKMMIRNAYGLTDEDIETLFGPQVTMRKFKKVEDVIALFESCAELENQEDEFVSEEFLTFREDAIVHEFKMGEPTLESKVLDLLKGNPGLIPERIARLLQVDSELIKTTIDKLLEKGQIENKSGTLAPTEKGIRREVPPVETEVYTVYKYVTRPDVPRVETTSRPFCKKMLELSRDGKVWTREALDKLTNETGEDAWIYRGGFYTNPDTGKTEPYCRHVWKAVTRVRTKK